jgi:aspartate kinase
VSGVPDRPGIAARLFRALADRAINVDMIVQNTSSHGLTDISFSVPKDDLAQSLDVAKVLGPEIGATDVLGDLDVARVSLVGAGMRSHPGVTATMFETLATRPWSRRCSSFTTRSSSERPTWAWRCPAPGR